MVLPERVRFQYKSLYHRYTSGTLYQHRGGGGEDLDVRQHSKRRVERSMYNCWLYMQNAVAAMDEFNSRQLPANRTDYSDNSAHPLLFNIIWRTTGHLGQHVMMTSFATERMNNKTQHMTESATCWAGSPVKSIVTSWAVWNGCSAIPRQTVRLILTRLPFLYSAIVG